MRSSEENPLDLNNLPEDYTRDGIRQPSEDSSSSAVGGGGSCKRKKSGGEDEKDDNSSGDGAKVYECRFCSLKFCKSQALGGHMNRHRQERETETLNKARHLVFTNDLAPGHIGYVPGNQPISHGGYHQPGNINDTTNLPFRPMYPPRLFSTIPPPPSPLPPPPPPQTAPFVYTPPRLLPFPSQQYPTPPNDYFLSHILPNSTEGNYTCIGAPVGHTFPNGGGGSGGRNMQEPTGSGGGGVRDVSMMNQEEGLNNWGRR